MKSLLRLSFIALTIVTLTGCYKRDIVVPQVDPLVGSWVLSDAAQGDSYGWQSIYTGLENGVFDFYGNGSARYTDGNLSMQGTWYINTVISGYYDEYGNYYNDSHQTMEVHLRDAYSNSTIDLYFDNLRFKSNRFVATYYNNHSIEKYWFSRY